MKVVVVRPFALVIELLALDRPRHLAELLEQKPLLHEPGHSPIAVGKGVDAHEDQVNHRRVVEDLFIRKIPPAEQVDIVQQFPHLAFHDLRSGGCIDHLHPVPHPDHSVPVDSLIPGRYVQMFGHAPVRLQESFFRDIVLPGKPVDCFVDSLQDSSVLFGVRFWIKASDYLKAKWSVTEEIKRRLDAEGITIPFNQLDVNIKQ